MNKLIRVFLILTVFLSLIPTAARFVFYEYKYLDFANFQSSPVRNLLEVDNHPAAQALRILAEHPTRKVFTFRQSDVISLNRQGWIDNFDPRAAIFFEAKSEKDLFKLLVKHEIKYILVPTYTWPTIYNTNFSKLLSNPNYAEPQIANIALNSETDNYQLFLVRENYVSISCTEQVVHENKFLKRRGGYPLRIFDTLLGIPTSFQSSLEEFKVSDLNKFENIGVNESSLLRIIYGNADWYDGNTTTNQTSRFTIRVKTQSNSLVSLSVQGISSRGKDRNLIKIGRLTNVSESLSAIKETSLSAQVLLEPDVGSFRLYLTSFSGPKEISKPVYLQICGIRDSSTSEELFPSIPDVTLASVPFTLKLRFKDCDSFGKCEPQLENLPFLADVRADLKSRVKSAYQVTQKVYSLNKDVSLKLKDIFYYPSSTLKPYSLRCVSNCPNSGIVSLEWTNTSGFLSTIDLAPSSEINGKSVQIFSPPLSGKVFPKVVLREYSEVLSGTAVYEFWREYVKK